MAVRRMGTFGLGMHLHERKRLVLEASDARVGAATDRAAMAMYRIVSQRLKE
jgi:hypothetical protein